MTLEIDVDQAAKDAEKLRELARREAFVQSLRALAFFLEDNPQVPAPFNDTMNIFVHGREELAAIARTGNWTKQYSGNYFTLAKAFGEDLSYEVNASRDQVCRKVVTGTRIVPYRPSEPEHEEPIEEWICDEASLLGSK